MDREQIEKELASASKLSVYTRGFVALVVTGRVVVALGRGVTEADLYEHEEEVAMCCPCWEGEYAEEDPDYVQDPTLDDADKEEDGTPPDCLLVRDEEGQIIVHRLTQ